MIEAWRIGIGNFVSRFAVALCALCVFASGVSAQDTESPQITSVAVAPTLVAEGDSVRVTVSATDNVGVSSVTANGVSLSNTSGSAWEGDVIADGVIGSHQVNVVASDAAGNSSSDASRSYLTAHVYGIQSKAALDSILRNTPATSTNLYRVWGKAHVLSENSFSVDDGGSYPVTVNAPGHDVCNGDFVVARGVLNPAAVPVTISDAHYTIEDLAPRTPINFGSNPAIGKDMIAPLSGHLVSPAPAGNLQVRITSADSSKLLVSNSGTEAGRESVTVQVNAGSTSVPAFYIHALTDSGAGALIATAPGCQGSTITVTFQPSGFIISSPNAISTTSFSGDTPVQVRPVRLNPSTLTYAATQVLRPGVSAQVSVVSSDSGVGTIIGSPVMMQAGDYSQTVSFQPVSPGQTTVSIEPVAGFTTPSNSQSIEATVTGPKVSITQGVVVGKDLQTAASVALQVSPPSPVDILVTSSDPSKVKLSKTANDPGSASVTFEGVSNTGAKTIYVEGLEIGQNITLTATASGYSSAEGAVEVQPSGFIISSPNAISTTSFSGD
ncbi:MAG: hypothetical protein IT209_11820, partial [Armatimonadetes bacterium]|nr:hypothetical protein [Armatimonadota bacterium]